MNLAKKNIQKMKKYTPPLDGRRKFKGFLLDFNEKTIPVSKNVLKALKDFVNSNQFQVYPEYGDLSEKIAIYANVKSPEVMIANGSDQGIDLIFRTFTKKGDKVLLPDPSFAMFYQCAEVMENKIKKIPYNEDLSFPLNKLLSSINKDTRLIVLCNPNNPTGTLIKISEIKKILGKALKNNAVVYIDEAYFEFSRITAASLIKEYPNLIISRTFSKAFGLASLRIGYVLSNVENINEMMKVRGPYDVCMPAVIAANAALDDLDSMNQYVDEVMTVAKPMVESFFTNNNLKYYPSNSNFILFKPKNEGLIAELKDEGFLMRAREGNNIDGTIRVTIGTVNQMKKFINNFKND